MVQGLSKQPVIGRSRYQLAIARAYSHGPGQNVFEWLYSYLGNTPDLENACNAPRMYRTLHGHVCFLLARARTQKDIRLIGLHELRVRDTRTVRDWTVA